MAQTTDADRPRTSPWWLVVAGMLILVSGALFRGFFVDDAYITFRYVDQWVHGNGLVYNVGDRLEGYSNFLWLLLLTPLHWLGIPLIVGAKLLGLAFTMATAGFLWHITRQWSRVPLALLFFSANPTVGAWAMGGLETPLFTFLLLLSLHRFWLEQETGRGWWSGVLLGLLALTRPEGAYFAIFLAGLHLWSAHRGTGALSRRDLWRVCLFGLIAGSQVAFRIGYYGALLPNTVTAKSMGLHPRGLLEGGFYLYGCVRDGWGVGVVLLAAAGALDRRPNTRWLRRTLAVVLAAFVPFLLLGAGDWMPLHRFGVHVAPVLALAAQLGAQTLLDRPRRWGRWPVIGLAALQTVVYLGGTIEQRFVQGVGRGSLQPTLPLRVQYLRRHVRPGDTIAVVDAGLIAYALPRRVRVIDMVGLLDRHIASRPLQFPGGLLGRGDGFGKWDVEYILRRKPRFVEVNLLGRAATGRWRTKFTGSARLLNHPRFRRRYDLVRERGVQGIFRRREAGRPPRRPAPARRPR